MKSIFSIKSKIFISHLFLVILLLLGLSYNFYQNSLSTYIQSVINFYKNSSSSIVSTASLAISGANYGNIQLPSFTKELSSNEKLLYLNIIGKSDYSQKEFSAVYDKKSQTIYRNKYSSDFKSKLEAKLKRFTDKLNDPSSDKVKLNFLIERTKDAINQYEENIKLSNNTNKEYDASLFNKSPYIDFEKNRLYLSLPTNNKKGGKVLLIFDVSEAEEIKNTLIKDLLIELFLALIFSIFVLNILSNKIIAPLNQLSKFMSEDFRKIDSSKTPALDNKDEIGVLSNRFKTLIDTIKTTHAKTEHKAYRDNLTNIHNRYKFIEVFEEELLRIKRYKSSLSIVLFDIDHFKSFNDIHGHLIGDEVLIMLTQAISKEVRETDLFARWGGEEFIIMYKETSLTNAKQISEKLRETIEKVNHPIAGKVTASFGVTQYLNEDTLDTMLKRCDTALYTAKRNGRNIVESV